MGITQAGGHPHFAQKAAGKIRITEEGGLDHLEGDFAQGLPLGIKLRGTIDHAHRPLAENREQAVLAADDLPPALGHVMPSVKQTVEE